MIGFGLVCLVAAIHGPAKVRRVYAAIAALFVAAGAATAIRQIWLQSVPADQLPSCLPSLEYMMEALPFQEIARLVLHGTAECAEVSWTMLGMSIPEWSLLGFIGMAIVCLWQLLRRDDRLFFPPNSCCFCTVFSWTCGAAACALARFVGHFA